MANFHFPAEWEKHSGLWLAWPHDRITFPNLSKAEKTYLEIIKHIHEDESVELLVVDEGMKTKIISLFSEKGIDVSKINFHVADYADVWARDYGPMYVINSETQELAWVKWNYNAYGNKFPDLLKDNEVFLTLRSKIDKRMLEPGIVMEGGAVELNGSGCLITTEQCLLNPNRNPALSQSQIETYLKENLGVKKIIWLKEGIVNDHTDGHIDDCVKFVDKNTLLCAYEENENDPNFPILKKNFEALEKATDAEGKPFKLIKLPMPHLNYDDGTKAPASYINFYIGNSVVLVPTFNDPNDSRALNIIQDCFPTRKVIGIDSTELINGGGTIHCITQQVPAVVK